MKNEFVLAFNEVLEEKQLPKEVILSALEQAMVSAYRRAVNASSAQQVDAKIDLQTGEVVIFAEKEIVDITQDDRTEVSLDDAIKIDPEAKIGGMALVESTPKNFGRVAAQTARQVIQQRIREAERDAQLSHFSRQTGEIVSGMIQAFNPLGVTLGLDMKAEGIMPRNHQIPGEKYRVHERIRALLLEVKQSNKGPQIILSRAHRNFLRRLLENEVPEIYHGMVEIRSIAREPGQRSKVAVSALQAGVDPVGACVGMRGTRIQAIVRELNDEKIDVIEWNSDPSAYIAKALSPARVTGVYLNEQARGAKTATVVVPEDQLSLAIGRDGQNARLAARLTSWRIDIKSLPEACADSLHKLQNDSDYASFADQEAEIIPQIEHILVKKSEGRPVTPEEYQLISHFVDRIERGILRQRERETKAEEERKQIAEANIPEEAFDMPLDDLGLPLRYSTLISGAGFISVGDLMLQMKIEPNAILGLDGIGAKAMQTIEDALSAIEFSTVVPELEIEAPSLVIEEEAVPSQQVDTTEIQVEPETEIVEIGSSLDLVGDVESATVDQIEQVAPVDEAVSESIPDLEESAIEAPGSIDGIFTWKPEEIGSVEYTPDDEDESSAGEKAAKKKKKKKFVEYEFDPDQAVTIAKKKRKRSGEGWTDEWVE